MNQSASMQKVTPGDNIMSDHDELLEHLSETKSAEQSIPPSVFVREPSVADNYISLVNTWNGLTKDMSMDNVINITPMKVKSVTNVANSITVGGQWVQQSFVEGGVNGTDRVKGIDIIYESDDDTQDANELEGKIDATYNKLCSLEIANADAIEAVHQVNGQLENISRNSFSTTKQLRQTDEKVVYLTERVEKLSDQFASMMRELDAIKNLIICTVRQTSDYNNQ